MNGAEVVMTAVNQAQVDVVVGALRDPHNGADLATAKALKAVHVRGGQVDVAIELGYPAAGYRQRLQREIEAAVQALPGVAAVHVEVSWAIQAHAVQPTLKPMAQAKNIIAVASGKGGVGKSTTAANLALALSAEGARVGVLDADIYGPSQPLMFGLQGQQPQTRDGKMMEPLLSYGVQVMSIGFLIDQDSPMVWRGPMVTQALQQLLGDTRWEGLDYLVIDLPPGTGDIQLTLSQRVPVSGAVVVTTPQDIALLDARKGLRMFEKVNVPVLGIVENMSTHICSRCGHEEHIFGAGGGAAMAEQYNVPLLGVLPLDIRIREEADGGKPSVVTDPEGAIALAYRELARNTAARLALKAKDFSKKFPNIVIKNT
jgi:ATP-binding protein involved in chromosome partitioning